MIASNTSSIPIASIARACQRRDRIAGMHFFNPVPLMGLVEVIRAAETTDATVEALTVLGRRMGRTPVTVKDSPGFLVNMGGRAYTTEGLRIAHEGVATPAQIDAIMRDCWHFRMGPFELMDLTGIDVNFPVSRIIYDGYMQDPRIKTSPNHMAMFDAGLYGRKVGKGWYEYEDGQPKPRPSPDFETDAAALKKIAVLGFTEERGTAGSSEFDVPFDGQDWELDPDEFADFEDDPELRVQRHMQLLLFRFCGELGLEVLGEDDGESPILCVPVGPDMSSVGRYHSDYRRVVGIDLAGDTSKRVTLMTAPGSDPDVLARVAATIIASGRKVTAIKDSPGFVGQRMVAMIANLGCYMAEIGLAAPRDIDLAMQLGLNYPHGPMELVEELGIDATFQVLEMLQRITGEERYRPTLWLKRRAELGLSIYTEN
ncbi:MAG: 3-hydroxyacyl-CoA dehydrogenase family protein [Paracoccaceae bacterium]